MLRPRFHRIDVARGQRRLLFTLERPNKTRALWAGLDLFDRRAFSGIGARGFTLEIKTFGRIR